MPYIRHSYKVIQYERQACPESKGISAGMWAVIRVTEEAIAFTDTKFQADYVAGVMERPAPHSEQKTD